MLPVIVFVAFWIILAFAIFFVAVRGGPRGARATLQTQSLAARRTFGALFAVVYLGFGVAVPLLFLTGNHANANKRVGAVKLTPAEQRGRELFGQDCAVCHTLAAANAIGKVGPNLDQLRPPQQLVLNTIKNGCLQNPPQNSPATCLGQGTMPSDLVAGRDATDVAQFVAKVAGRE